MLPLLSEADRRSRLSVRRGRTVLHHPKSVRFANRNHAETAAALGFVGDIAGAISDYPLRGSARLSAIRTKSARDFAPIFFMTL
jgi:hypothetical protein